LQGIKDKGVDYSQELVVGLNELGTIPVKAGSGIGAVEVPRGILFHEYEIDHKGKIINANCVIPTGQNLNNIEHDMAALVPQILDKSQEEIILLMEMLVRAYDPCISCSAHFLNVKFIGR
jgi:coenzyme F420-reducing hydrogenase alpha subunit